MTTWLSKMGASALLLTISSVAMAQSATNSITENVVEVEVFSTLETAVVKAGLDATLDGSTQYTVFAPDDSAFSAAGTTATDLLVDGMEAELANVLQYHVVEGSVMASELSDGQMIETLQGQSLEVEINGSTVTINGATVVTADIESENGFIHRIDSLLVPQTSDQMSITQNIMSMPDYSTLEDAVVKAGLAPALSGSAEYTVFAPNNAAFTAAGSAAADLMVDGMETELANVLQYHVVEGSVMASELSDGQMIETLQGQELEVSINGGTVMVGGATVTTADIETSNGVIHGIDTVLMPTPMTAESITKIVVDSNNFTSLEAALIKANLADTLDGTDAYTVFAPNDIAFTAAGDVATTLMMDGNENNLSAVLQYHVVAGKVMAADLSDGQMITTLNGAELEVSIDGDVVMVDGVTVTNADMETNNGVIHEINAILMPNDDLNMTDKTTTEVVVEMEDFNTLEAALGQADLAATFNGSTEYTVFAPDNAAFAAIQKTVDELLKVENKPDLASVLQYHVIEGRVLADELEDGMMVETLNGQDLEVTINAQNEIRINGALVTMADIRTSNGIVHRIDAVLVPSAEAAEPTSVFADLSSTDNVAAIAELKTRGIIEGYPDGSYRPNNSINRAEFIKIIVEANMEDNDIYGANCFPDVKDEWYAPYICTAQRMGIVSGYPDGTFHPENKVRMTEAYKIIAETMFETEIGDEGNLWYDKYVDTAMDNNFYLGSTVEMGARTNRNQMATMIYGGLMKKED